VYFAVTTNTVQFGARLELYFGISGFEISGEVGFDVLVQIAPLHIETHVYARLSVRAGGADICSISLDLTLQGPTPWIAHGTAKFKILLFTVHVTLDATIGQAASTSLPAVPVLSELIAQLSDAANWAAELSAGTASLITLLPPAAGDLVIDAAGLLTVRQRLIPLATDVLLVGAAPPADVRRVTITGMRVGTAAAGQQDDHEDVTDPFAPVAFRTMSDQDRLRAPAYEQRPSGARSRSGQALTSDLALAHTVMYERIVMDTARSQATVKDKTGAPNTFSDLVAGGAVGDSRLSRLRARQAEQGSRLDAGTTEERFAVTALGDLRPVGDHGQVIVRVDAEWPDRTLLPRSDAEARLAGLSAAGGRYQIVPEVQIAA
jgi:hypothetical protein